jgi:hypothetical protein
LVGPLDIPDAFEDVFPSRLGRTLSAAEPHVRATYVTTRRAGRHRAAQFVAVAPGRLIAGDATPFGEGEPGYALDTRSVSAAEVRQIRREREFAPDESAAFRERMTLVLAVDLPPWGREIVLPTSLDDYRGNENVALKYAREIALAIEEELGRSTGAPRA